MLPAAEHLFFDDATKEVVATPIPELEERLEVHASVLVSLSDQVTSATTSFTITFEPQPIEQVQEPPLVPLVVKDSMTVKVGPPKFSQTPSSRYEITLSSADKSTKLISLGPISYPLADRQVK